MNPALQKLDAEISARLAMPAHSTPDASESFPLMAALAPAITLLEKRTLRNCRDCGAEFEAVGFTAYCDPCGIKVDERASQPPVKKLDSSWPRLHAEKLNDLHGPALSMAERLAPKLFGDRLLVLAGDRGRGKTQIATFIAYHRMTKGHDCGIYTRSFDMIKLCSQLGAEGIKSLRSFQKVPFLCIDEAHRIEARHIHTLESVLDERYANKRPTIVIGNWMTDAGVRDGETISGQKLFGLGPTLMDRINEHKHNHTGGIVWCRWDSYRTPSA